MKILKDLITKKKISSSSVKEKAVFSSEEYKAKRHKEDLHIQKNIFFSMTHLEWVDISIRDTNNELPPCFKDD